MKNNKVIQEVAKAVKKANFSLRSDVLTLLKKAYRNESNKRAKYGLAWILENAKVAKNQSLAICQDTGFPIVFIEASNNTNINVFVHIFLRINDNFIQNLNRR